MSEPGEATPTLTPRQAAQVLRLHSSALEALYVERLQLMRTLRRKGWTHPQIAEKLGLTKQRVQQLLRDASSKAPAK